MTPDEVSRALQAWIDAHPARPLKDWEQRAHDRAFEVEPPEVDDWDGSRADEAAARYENGWLDQARWAR